MTGESARHWIYVSGDLDIERLAGDNDGMRAVSREVGLSKMETVRGEPPDQGAPRFRMFPVRFSGRA